MKGSRVSILTPPGTGAIATIELRGAGAWDSVRNIFRPTAAALSELPELHRVWFGRFGDGGDEVVLAVKHLHPEPVLEIHCHGGIRVVRWVVDQVVASGTVETRSTYGGPWPLLPQARTLRTAAILLDQWHGAFDRVIAEVINALDRGDAATAGQLLDRLAVFDTVGRHLFEPWNVVVAGAPNVGKSSLVNALAGYQRAIVSEQAGTTRDVLIMAAAFDGWPVELADTAGLHGDASGVEASGIDLARHHLKRADVVIWVLDATVPDPVWPQPGERQPEIIVSNKSDAASPSYGYRDSALIHISARTGSGLDQLIASLTRLLVPTPPCAGDAVPYSPALADAIDAAVAAVQTGNLGRALQVLQAIPTCPE